MFAPPPAATLRPFRSASVAIGNSTTYFGPRAGYEGKPVPANGHVSLRMDEAVLPTALTKAFEDSK